MDAGREYDGEGREYDGEGREYDGEGREYEGAGREYDGAGREYDGAGRAAGGVAWENVGALAAGARWCSTRGAERGWLGDAYGAVACGA